MTTDMIRNQAALDQQLQTWRNAVRAMVHQCVRGVEPGAYETGVRMLLDEMDSIFEEHQINDHSTLVVGLARIKLLELLHEYAGQCINTGEA